MAARKIGPVSPDGCFDKLGEEASNAIFKNIRQLGNYSKQKLYFVSASSACEKKIHQEESKHTYELRIHSEIMTKFLVLSGIVWHEWSLFVPSDKINEGFLHWHP